MTPMRRLTLTGSAIGSMSRIRKVPPVGRSSPVRHLIVVDFPGAVRPEEPIEAAARHGEIDAVDRDEIAERFAKAGRGDGERRRH